MTPQDIELIQQHPAFIQLVRRKQKLYWSLSLIMLVIYFGFVLLVAFSPATLGQSLNGGVTSVGMLVGVVMVILAFALTGFYVYRANHVIDPLNDKLKQECAQ
ncbi:Inner membrane protein YjcH [compost metagenome]